MIIVVEGSQATQKAHLILAHTLASGVLRPGPTESDKLLAIDEVEQQLALGQVVIVPHWFRGASKAVADTINARLLDLSEFVIFVEAGDGAYKNLPALYRFNLDCNSTESELNETLNAIRDLT